VESGVHADFDARGKLIGIEIIDASEIMESKIEFTLPGLPRDQSRELASIDS